MYLCPEIRISPLGKLTVYCRTVSYIKLMFLNMHFWQSKCPTIKLAFTPEPLLWVHREKWTIQATMVIQLLYVSHAAISSALQVEVQNREKGSKQMFQKTEILFPSAWRRTKIKTLVVLTPPIHLNIHALWLLQESCLAQVWLRTFQSLS